jgi:hypothetical protein
MWARRRCHSRDSEIVRGFRVVFVRGTVVGGLRGPVLAAHGEAVWSELVVVDSVIMWVLNPNNQYNIY